MGQNNNNVVQALYWIVEILSKKQISFQITGGLAAKIYGSKHPLADIDIDVPDNQIEKIVDDVKEYIVFGPARYKDEHWDVYMLALNYKGQVVELVGSDSSKIYHRKANEWQLQSIDFKKSANLNIYGISVPVISKSDLIAYKTILNREVDRIDLIDMGE